MSVEVIPNGGTIADVLAARRLEEWLNTPLIQNMCDRAVIAGIQAGIRKGYIPGDPGFDEIASEEVKRVTTEMFLAEAAK